MKWRYGDARIGDMVRVKLGNIYHYGIYAENDEVIQFGLPPTPGRNAADVKVISAPTSEFLAGGFMEVGEPESGEKKYARSRENVYLCAESRIGEGGYDIINNNCEHFAYECMFGTKYSSQTDSAHAKFNVSPTVDVYMAKFPFDVRSETVYPDMRRDQIAECTNQKVRDGKFYVWKLLEHGLNRSFGLDIEKIRFKYKNGKWTCKECFFSLSHSGDVVAVALSCKPIGVDAEIVAPEKFCDGKLLDAFLSDDEKLAFGGRSDSEKSECANVLWTVKEAAFKCGTDKKFEPKRIETHNVRHATKFVLADGTRYAVTVVSDEADKAVFYIGNGLSSD